MNFELRQTHSGRFSIYDNKGNCHSKNFDFGMSIQIAKEINEKAKDKQSCETYNGFLNFVISYLEQKEEELTDELTNFEDESLKWNKILSLPNKKHKMKAIVLDLETSGGDVETLDILQCAILKIEDGAPNYVYSEYFGLPEGHKISLGARNACHITYRDVEGKKLFQDSELLKYLISIQNKYVFIAHNGIEFDFKVLERFGFKPKFIIDSLRVAENLFMDKRDKDFEDSYKLQILRYFYEDKTGLKATEGNAHNALADVEALAFVIDNLMEEIKIEQGLGDKEIIDLFVKLSKKKRYRSKIGFGKHAGKTYEEVITQDLKENLGYFNWIFEKMDSDFAKKSAYFWLNEYLETYEIEEEEEKKLLNGIVEKYREQFSV